MNEPYALQCEQSVLGALLQQNDVIDRLGALRAEHFYRADHRAIFGLITDMITNGIGADVVTVFERLRSMDAHAADLGYLNDLALNTPSAANVHRYAETVLERAQCRGLARVGSEIAAMATAHGRDTAAAMIDVAQQKLEALATTRKGSDPILAADGMGAYLTLLEQRVEGAGADCISTGFADLDRLLSGGFRRGELIVVAGRPKMGKTALALSFARNAAHTHSAGVLSLEMPLHQLHDRNIAALGGPSLQQLLAPRAWGDEEWTMVTSALQQIEQLKLSLDEQGGLRLMDVRQKARAIKRKRGLDLLVIDYLQLMDGEGDNRNNVIETITRGLKSLAKELDVAIVLLSQLNRELERRPNKRPQPSDLRDSGAIEQDCDTLIFVYRDEVYNPDTVDQGIAEIIVALSRQGAPGRAGLRYDGPHTRFRDLVPGTVFGAGPAKRITRGGLKD